MGFRPFQYTTPEFGQKDFEQARDRFQNVSTKYGDLVLSAAEDVREGATAAKGLGESFRPGGSFGAGRRAEAKQDIDQGVARTNAQLVGAGQSSIAGSRGINVLAASERAKRNADIDDRRAELELQSFTPYTQMLSSLANLASAGTQIATAGPTRREFITQGKSYISGLGRAIS